MAMWGEDDSFDGAFTFGSVAKPKNAVKSNAVRVVARTEECVKPERVNTTIIAPTLPTVPTALRPFKSLKKQSLATPMQTSKYLRGKY